MFFNILNSSVSITETVLSSLLATKILFKSSATNIPAGDFPTSILFISLLFKVLTTEILFSYQLVT